MASPAVIQFREDMTYLTVFGKYVCQCKHPKCRHVWVSNRLPKACARCKKITWNREDKRFTGSKAKTQRSKKGKRRI